MKILIAFFLGFALVVQCSESNAQTTLDTIQARKFVLLADKYAKELSLDSSAIYYRKAAHIYKSIATTKKDTLMVSKYLECLCSISAIFSQESKFVDSKNTLDSALTISLKNFGNEHLQTARVYHYYGTLYYYESKYDESLEFLFKEAEIYRRNLTMDIYTIADNNFWIGADYIEKGEPDKAIEFTSKCIEILKENPGKDKLMLANAYDQMAKL
jgi:tetratricopeptide (TPR) repeat protein